MYPDAPVPYARSEPQNIGDEVVSELMWLLADWLSERSAPSPERSEVSSRLWPLLEAAQNDAALSSLLAKLPNALGGGFLLQSLFARLFPADPKPLALPRDPKVIPRLTPREKEILLKLAQGCSRSQIASDLFISEGVVHRHTDNIYAKLKTKNATEAVLKAAGWGLVSFDLVKLMEPMADGSRSDFNHVMQALLHYAGLARKEAIGEALAQLGLLLLVISTLLPYTLDIQRECSRTQAEWGRIFVFTSEGKLRHTWDGGGYLHCPCDLTFAPHAAKQHGFQPGHLYIIDQRSYPDPLNLSSILKMTPEGEPNRAFTGGKYLSTRLTGPHHLAFMRDGRLMATTGWNTDAILEFTEGGAQVRRFADLVPYGGVAAGRDGNLYAIEGRWYRTRVKAFSPQGEMLREIGEHAAFTIGEEQYFYDVAVGSEGHIYIANARDGCIKVYDRLGVKMYCFGEGVLKHPFLLAISPRNILYIMDGAHETPDVEVLGFDVAHKTWMTRFAPPDGAIFHDLTVGPDGNLYLCGQQS